MIYMLEMYLFCGGLYVLISYDCKILHVSISTNESAVIISTSHIVRAERIHMVHLSAVYVSSVMR